jgi:hypothetical protein
MALLAITLVMLAKPARLLASTCQCGTRHASVRVSGGRRRGNENPKIAICPVTPITTPSAGPSGTLSSSPQQHHPATALPSQNLGAPEAVLLRPGYVSLVSPDRESPSLDTKGHRREISIFL